MEDTPSFIALSILHIKNFTLPKRDIINKELIVKKIDEEPQFGRKIWGLLSLELWFQEFYDKFEDFKKM